MGCTIVQGLNALVLEACTTVQWIKTFVLVGCTVVQGSNTLVLKGCTVVQGIYKIKKLQGFWLAVLIFFVGTVYKTALTVVDIRAVGFIFRSKYIQDRL